MKTQTILMQQHVVKNVCFLSFMMLFCLFVNPMNAQNTDRTVTGVVNSLDGPLLGATIILKGTTIGAISNEAGAFTFPKKLQENDVLVVNYLGYKTQEVIINRGTTFIQPFLEDNPIIIHGALRAKDATVASGANKN
jgi:hypothetical protein